MLPPNQNVTYRVLAVALDGSASEPSAPVTLRPLQAPTPVIFLPLKGTLDEASGLHPQVHGAPSFETINERKVLRLGPGRWLAFEDRPEFDIPCEITLEAWVRFDDLSGMPVLIGHSRWMERGYFLQVLGGAVRFHLALEGGGLNADAGRIAPGQWVHIVGTFDGDVARVYVNGEQVGAFQRPNSLAPFIVPYSGPLYIGRYHEESPMYEVHGCLGGVAVFNGALSAETVRARFDAGL